MGGGKERERLGRPPQPSELYPPPERGKEGERGREEEGGRGWQGWWWPLEDLEGPWIPAFCFQPSIKSKQR